MDEKDETPKLRFWCFRCGRVADPNPGVKCECGMSSVSTFPPLLAGRKVNDE